MLSRIASAYVLRLALVAAVALGFLVGFATPAAAYVQEKCDTPYAKYHCVRADASWSGGVFYVAGSWNRVGTPAPDYGWRSMNFVQYQYATNSSGWINGFYRSETLWRDQDPLAAQPYYCGTCTSKQYTASALRIIMQFKWYNQDGEISYEPVNPYDAPYSTILHY